MMMSRYTRTLLLLVTLLHIQVAHAFIVLDIRRIKCVSVDSSTRRFSIGTSRAFAKRQVLRDAPSINLPIAALQLARYDDDEDIEDERELVKVPRGRRKGKYYNDDDDDESDYTASSSRRASYFDEDEYDEDDDEEDDEPLDEQQVNRELSDLFENVIIPNPLLDSMDPDGAADRFWPELARDPRFWFDLALLIAFLNFVSFAGPRDTLADLPWWY
ncbi:hypothetical protein MPSEU_000272900 [Mayamaea pseudoterrestris]|nr:hypothetical protein MPSEU_000272900 [Mayamaea pseudoterrestris]